MERVVLDGALVVAGDEVLKQGWGGHNVTSNIFNVKCEINTSDRTNRAVLLDVPDDGRAGDNAGGAEGEDDEIQNGSEQAHGDVAERTLQG